MGVHTSVTPDAMTLASDWGMMSRTLEAFATKTQSRAIEGEVKGERPSRNQKNSKTTQTVA